MNIENRWKFAALYALRHAFLSMVFVLVCAICTFLLWYPTPYREIFDVTNIFLMVAFVDVVCGPLLTFILASPTKKRREKIVDFSFIGIIQILALAYGMHSVWVARPAVFAFEKDRFTVIAANEFDHENLVKAPIGLQKIPYIGLLKVATRNPENGEDFIRGIELSARGISPAMRPDWWVPISEQQEQLKSIVKPLTDLVASKPEKSAELKKAADDAGYAVVALTYIPLTSSQNKDWVALLNSSLEMVGFAAVDGFE